MKDWDEAYANAAYIENGASYPEQWAEQAQQFRTQHPLHVLPYGTHEREVIHWFKPSTAPKGLAVFVHGGYWMAFDPSYWSHLAAGALAQGWVVALPGYVLTPEARIATITQSIGNAINRLAEYFTGDICLAGHSAGGHLVTRMMCTNTPLTPNVQSRLKRVTSISGLHDLRPLLHTQMNSTLQLDTVEAVQESPALLSPLTTVSLTCWVGAKERPEFIRQNDLLAHQWSGLNEDITNIHAPNHHHFSVIADLVKPDSALTQAFIGR